MKFATLLLPLLVISCAAHKSTERKIASEDQTLPVKISFSSTDGELKDDGVFPLISNLSYVMSNLPASGPGKSSIKITFPTHKADVKSVKLKRVFLFADRMEKKQKLQNFMQQLMFGDKPANLKFMRELTIQIYPGNLDEAGPVFSDKPNHKEIPNSESLLKYDSKANSGLPLTNVYLFKSKNPVETKQFIDEVISDRSVKNFDIVDDVVIIELKNDSLIKESFVTTMSNYAEKLEGLGVIAIDQCNKEICIDFNVSDENLAPLFKQHDALSLDAYIKSYMVPDLMKFRGHIEFEVKLNEDY